MPSKVTWVFTYLLGSPFDLLFWLDDPSLSSWLVLKLLQSCLTLCDRDPADHSLPGCSVHGVLQARLLEWVAVPSSGDLPHPGIEPVFLMSPALAGSFFTTEPPGKPLSVLEVLK